MVDGPRAGLAALEALDNDERLAGSHRLIAVRAHLLERAGDQQAAIELYRAAAARTTSTPERNYLLMRAARLSG
jgi:predicted RNA polymerase sigma factor